VLLRKQAAAWRVVEIEMLAAGEESGADLSNLALAVLFDSNVKALPDEAGSQALALPAGELLGALLAGILLGLALHRLGRRPLPDGKLPGALSGASFWLPTVAGLAAGLVLFGLGLSRYLHEHGAVEELKAHGLSLARLQDGDLEGALKAWPQNQAAQVRKAEVLASMGKPEDAQRYLAALAQTKTPPPAVYLNLARLQQRGERPAEAAASLGKFGDLLGGDALIYIQAAQQAARGRDFRLADELLRRAQAVEPPDAVMLLARASIHAAERRPAEVIADFKAVLGQGAAQPRDLLLLIERTPDFDPVRNDPAFVKFVKGLAGGEAPPAVGPVRRNP
jgi:Tfp pilus assembly protein PilF